MASNKQSGSNDGRGEVKNPETDGRLKENRGSGSSGGGSKSSGGSGSRSSGGKR